MLTHVLAMWLALSPPEAVLAIGAAELTAKIEAVLTMPDAATIAELEQTIAAMEAQPLVVVADPILAEDLLRARVVLAWGYDDPQKASAAMDEVVRSAGGRPLPLAGLGTDLKSLAKERVAALAAGGTANIQVDCSMPCQIILNERIPTNLAEPLALGTYRVWVVASAGEIEPLHEDVVLDQAGQTKLVVFGEPSPPLLDDPRDTSAPTLLEPEDSQDTSAPLLPEPKKPTDTRTQALPIEAPEQRSDVGEQQDELREPPPAQARPMLPLWSEIVGVIAGVGMLATGVALLALDGKCRNGREVRSCPELIENTPQGIALVGMGSGVLLTFGAVLSVDRVRMDERKGLAAVASWTFRF